MKTLLSISALSLGLLATSAAQAQQPHLGRLFFTPEQRTQFDYGKFQEGNATSSDSLTLNGIVQKHGGSRTAWINGVPQRIGKSDERNPANVPVAVPNRAQPVTVKVGQKINVTPPNDSKP
jgi:hypothetical protein